MGIFFTTVKIRLTKTATILYQRGITWGSERQDNSAARVFLRFKIPMKKED